jgi:hypothetical protein
VDLSIHLGVRATHGVPQRGCEQHHAGQKQRRRPESLKWWRYRRQHGELVQEKKAKEWRGWRSSRVVSPMKDKGRNAAGWSLMNDLYGIH